ncbi:hypothetical protein JIP62_12615 [Brevundimonas vitis]|uniref:Uncharacterized protein n=1 Tax=Brevundimonas vitisensis TaxID=2800818 RepID=A0ABX7BLM6_9CAUL|nr:hypothetical protein [Brevundimonas vitisensis]QQQ18141.1 hypothetical protein JIP62_12615 [Brevundimonas vitisensis]
MEHFRLRKYRSAEVWRRVRIAYEEGEPGPAVARRFDVGLANLRKKASREGWTRAAQALRADPPPQRPGPDRPEPAADPVPPHLALAQARTEAARLLAAGRPAEALTLLKAVEALSRVLEAHPQEAEAEQEPTPEEMAALEAQVRARWEARQAEVRVEADKLARAMLEGTDPGHVHSLYAHRWRAETLGPEVAQADFARASQTSSHPRDWTPDGQLLPPGAHDDRNWNLHRPRAMAAALGRTAED